LRKLLHRLARNLWWTWNQDAQDLFQELSPRSWQNLYHNAVAVLREVTDYELKVHLMEPAFRARVKEVLADFDAYLKEPAPGGRRERGGFERRPVAYFSAEFGFHETLPIAAGGLGILAGDHAKAASDLGLGSSGSACSIVRVISSRPSTQQLADGVLLVAGSQEPADRARARRERRAAEVLGPRSG
jgi:glucan phosphorylase